MLSFFENIHTGKLYVLGYISETAANFSYSYLISAFLFSHPVPLAHVYIQNSTAEQIDLISLKKKCWGRCWNGKSATQTLGKNSTWWEKLEFKTSLHHGNLEGEGCLYQKALAEIVPVLPKSTAPQHHVPVAGQHSSYENVQAVLPAHPTERQQVLQEEYERQYFFYFPYHPQYKIYNLSRTLIVMGTLPASGKWR